MAIAVARMPIDRDGGLIRPLASRPFDRLQIPHRAASSLTTG
jgi:hypothetical protein